jgi:phosphoribosylformylglycinamidine synthase
MQKLENPQEIALAHSLTLEEYENIIQILGREPNHV